jgi:hypothetical protein
MPPKSKRRIFAALFLLLATAETPSYSYVGIQGLALVGQHVDTSLDEHGVGAGALLEVHVGGPRFAVHLEDIPVVGIPGVRPSVTYGQATPSLGIFNGDAEYAIDRAGTTWFGFGQTVYNQRTPLPAIGQVVSSRLSGARYTLRYRRPLQNGRFIEAFVGNAPYLGGADVYVLTNHAVAQLKPERASEVDSSLSYGFNTGHHTQWLIGLRSLDFSARFPVTGLPADRNVGIGPIIEWRDLLK